MVMEYVSSVNKDTISQEQEYAQNYLIIVWMLTY